MEGERVRESKGRGRGLRAPARLRLPHFRPHFIQLRDCFRLRAAPTPLLSSRCIAPARARTPLASVSLRVSRQSPFVSTRVSRHHLASGGKQRGGGGGGRPGRRRMETAGRHGRRRGGGAVPSCFRRCATLAPVDLPTTRLRAVGGRGDCFRGGCGVRRRVVAALPRRLGIPHQGGGECGKRERDELRLIRLREVLACRKGTSIIRNALP